MGRVKISYYIVKRGRGFWNPSAAMKRAGFAAVPCGLDGPEAWAVAETWNKRWAACRRGVVAPRWPEGALGEAFDRFRSTETWKRKATKTRQEWEAMSRLYIMPIFGDHRPPGGFARPSRQVVCAGAQGQGCPRSTPRDEDWAGTVASGRRHGLLHCQC